MQMVQAGETGASHAGTELRMVQRMEIYWRRICRGRIMPTMNDINPNRLPAPWKSCFILSLGAKGDDGVFDHVGSEITRDSGTDLLGKGPAEVPADTLTAITLAALGQVRDSCEATIAEGHLLHRNGGKRLYRTVLLPFGREEDGVDTVIGALSWREGERSD
jgi:hypothetical protein